MVFGIVCAGLVVFVPPRFRPPFYKRVMKAVFRILMRAFSAIITYHQKENRPRSPGICVANHTSYLDVIVLGSDNNYAMVGQRQGGFFGLCETLLSRGAKHIWFERSSAEDRSHVVKLMQEHLGDERNLPIVIFPEGTCINNTSVMQFKKGAFEIVNATVYPVAIRYDPTFADAFWNSSVAGMLSHMIGLMTSWAVVVDVYYLPPLKRKPGESGLQFANRVRLEIVQAGSFADVDWDGQLKREKPKSVLKTRQQAEVSEQILRSPSIAAVGNSGNSTPSHSAAPRPSPPAPLLTDDLSDANDLRKRVNLSSSYVRDIADLNGNLHANLSIQ
jgi:glycerol-3-phosphate O-acyltransferase 3/4